MRVRAAVLEEFGAPLAVQEVELEEPHAGEVLVRLVASGVCHTDLYTASGADPALHGHLDLPRVPGHAGDRAGEEPARGAARAHLPLRLRPLHRPRRGDEHRSGAAGLDLRRL